MTGVDLEPSYRFDVGGGKLALRAELQPAARSSSAWSSDPIGDFVTRDLTGEYEYPEDRATLSADWDTEKFGRVRGA